MIQWKEIVKEQGYKSVESMLHDLYIKKKCSMHTIALKLNVSVISVLHQLRKCGIKCRGRGGRNYYKEGSVSLKEYLQYTSRELAKKRGVSTAWVYARTRKWREQGHVKKRTNPQPALSPPSSTEK